MNKYIHVSKEIENICHKNGLLDLTSYINYTDFSKDNNFYQENYFSHSVFFQEPGLFTNKGKILKIFKKFKSKDFITNNSDKFENQCRNNQFDKSYMYLFIFSNSTSL